MWNIFQELLSDYPHHGYTDSQLTYMYKSSLDRATLMLVHQLANVDVTTKSRHWSRNTIQPTQVVSYDNSDNIALRAQVKALE